MKLTAEERALLAQRTWTTDELITIALLAQRMAGVEEDMQEPEPRNNFLLTYLAESSPAELAALGQLAALDRSTIEYERESDGRWIAEVIDAPGAMAYGVTREAARDAALEIAAHHVPLDMASEWREIVAGGMRLKTLRLTDAERQSRDVGSVRLDCSNCIGDLPCSTEPRHGNVLAVAAVLALCGATFYSMLYLGYMWAAQ